MSKSEGDVLDGRSHSLVEFDSNNGFKAIEDKVYG